MPSNPIINIITAVSRPENLYVLKSIIVQEILPYFDTTWYCIYDPGKDISMVEFEEPWIRSGKGGIKNDISGSSQRNLALDMIESGFNYFLDDDNIMYENFGKIMQRHIFNNPDIGAFIFNQPRHSGNLIAAPQNIQIGSIDVAQILAHKNIIGKKRFFPNVYQSDYFFIKRIYKRNNTRFLFINEDLCHYNYLRR